MRPLLLFKRVLMVYIIIKKTYVETRLFGNAKGFGSGKDLSQLTQRYLFMKRMRSLYSVYAY